MRKKLYTVVMSLIFLNIQAESYRIEQIESLDLSNESNVFTSFRTIFAHQSNDALQEMFDQEQQAYLQKSEKRLFFHALLGDQVIGYISSDLVSPRHIIVRQWAIEPSIFDVVLIKDLLFAVFAKMNKVQTLWIFCPAESKELISFFLDLGFVPVEHASDAQNIVFEFKKSSKCKLCDLLYENIWEEADDQDDSEEGIVVLPTDLVMSDVDYN